MNWSEIEFEKLYASPSKNGLTRPTRVRGSGHKMINMGELFANDRIGDIDMELVPMNDKELSTMRVEPGDLLFARQSLVLAGAGKCSLVTKADEPTTFESHIIRVRLKREIADPAFFHYYFKSPICRIRSIVTQGVQAGIRGNDLKKLKVHVPPVSEQRRIASILSAYDDLIENNRRRIQLLEQAARLLYREWFVHLRFPGHEHVTITDGVPEGWEKVPLSELCTDVRESANPKDLAPDTAYIGLEHIPMRSITLNDWGMSSEVNSNKFKFAEGDILFGKIRPYFHKVGFTLVDGIASSDAIVIRPTDSHLYHYVLFLLSSDEFVALASKTVREGSKMPRADWKFLLKSEFKCPSETLLDLFDDAVKPICGQLRNLALHSQQLTQARDLLLPRLMNGEVAV
ncbi:MAG: restriction endonuclease subunit S [Methanosarcinales archaeon]|nr:restriction endonuclease subunit S [Methanosarcinales archaeon]